MLAGEKEVSNKADTLREEKEEEELLHWQELDPNDDKRLCRPISKVGDTIYVKIWLGDPDFAMTRLWAKRVTNVDPTKKGGYAFEGEFLKHNIETHCVTLAFESENDLYAVVAQVGGYTWAYPWQQLFLYRRVGDKIYFTRLEWDDLGSRQKTIQKVYEALFKKKRPLNEIIATEIARLEQKYNVKIDWKLQK